MQAKWTLAVLVMTFWSVVVAGSGDKGVQTGISALDINGDNVVSPPEAAANPDLAKRFEQFDKNQDQRLEEAEFALFYTTRMVVPQ